MRFTVKRQAQGRIPIRNLPLSLPDGLRQRYDLPPVGEVPELAERAGFENQ